MQQNQIQNGFQITMEEKLITAGLEEMVDVEKLLAELPKHLGYIEKVFCKECF